MSVINRRWWLGLTVGLVTGVGVLVGGMVVAVIGLGAALLLASTPPRGAAVGGLLCGFGSTWLALFGRVQLTCDEGCGSTDLVPLFVFAATMLLIGAVLTAWVFSASRRRVQDQVTGSGT